MNIYMIETPLQLINAIEAKHHYKWNKNTIIILLRGLFKKSYFNKLLKYSDWDKVKYVDCRYRFRNYDFGKNQPRNLFERSAEIMLILNQGLQKRRLDKLAQTIGSVDNLILGDYRLGQNDQMRHFANQIKCKKIFMIDDGTDTILVNNERKKDIISNKNSHLVPKTWKIKLRRKYIDFDKTGVDTLTYFTCFNIDINDKDRIDINNYQYLRSISKNSDKKDSVTFLGQCLVDDGYVDFDIYLKYIKFIYNYFEGRSFKYIPHPRESKKYVGMLSDKLKIDVQYLELPVEYETVYGKERSKYMASFFCSALQNCEKIQNQDVIYKSFVINDRHLLKNHKNVADIYDYFESKTAIEVIRPDI